MNKNIKPESIDFKTLIRNPDNKFSEDFQSAFALEIKKSFTEEEQKWYIANLYMYLNYHSTNDYPINLENVFKLIGFANKGNAMKTIKSNFTLDEMKEDSIEKM